jgi:hypothetical protein
LRLPRLLICQAVQLAVKLLLVQALLAQALPIWLRMTPLLV